MAGINLTSSEICAILDACSKNKVKTLKYGRLEVDFDLSLVPASLSEGFASHVVEEAALLHPPSESLEGEYARTEEGISLLEELRRAQLMTDDPLAYEQEMIDANLDRQAVDDAIEVHRRTE